MTRSEAAKLIRDEAAFYEEQGLSPDYEHAQELFAAAALLDAPTCAHQMSFRVGDKCVKCGETVSAAAQGPTVAELAEALRRLARITKQSSTWVDEAADMDDAAVADAVALECELEDSDQLLARYDAARSAGET